MKFHKEHTQGSGRNKRVVSGPRKSTNVQDRRKEGKLAHAGRKVTVKLGDIFRDPLRKKKKSREADKKYRDARMRKIDEALRSGDELKQRQVLRDTKRADKKVKDRALLAGGILTYVGPRPKKKAPTRGQLKQRSKRK